MMRVTATAKITLTFEMAGFNSTVETIDVEQAVEDELVRAGLDATALDVLSWQPESED